MSKINLPVTWEMSGFVEIEADTIEKAIEYFEENIDSIELPESVEYVDGSFRLTMTKPEDIALYNEGVPEP